MKNIKEDYHNATKNQTMGHSFVILLIIGLTIFLSMKYSLWWILAGFILIAFI